VLGLYNSLASPVKIVDTEPVVADANVGYRFVAVDVSFESVTPPAGVTQVGALEPFDCNT
jgi:hypothetical protein